MGNPKTPVPELLKAVQDAGVELVVKPPDRILFDGHLDPDLVSELQARAREVVTYLEGGPGEPAPRPQGAVSGRDLRRELEILGDDEPKAIRIENPGDTVVGVVLEYRKATTDYGEAVVCHMVNEDTGELVALWLLHEVLMERFRTLRPKVGERIAVRRLKDDPEGKYKRYRVLVDRPSTQVGSLEKILGRGGEERPDAPPDPPASPGPKAPPLTPETPPDELPF